MKKIIILLILSLQILTLEAQAQALPSQDDIVKNGALRYFKRLPFEGWERLLHLAKMGTFELMMHQHKTKPLASPFRIFHSTSDRRSPSIDWSLFIKNNNDEYKDIMELKYGVCAGLTMVTRKLQLLAHFDPTNKLRQKVPSKKFNFDAWFSFMKNKIDQMITHNRMEIIPYFKDIQQLTSEPLLVNYFKEHIIRQWELVNINFLQGLFQGYAGTLIKMKKETTLKHIKTLEHLLSLGINPIVYLSAPSQKMFSPDQWIHMVQVTRIIKNANAISLEVWDPNLEDPKYSSLVNLFEDGKLMFGNFDLAGIYPLRWDTYEIADMIEKNLEFCIARPGFCTTKPKQSDQAILK